MAEYDLVVRGGSVADGTGTGTRDADVEALAARIHAAVAARPGLAGEVTRIVRGSMR